jgi:hypothetical protein
MNIIEQINDAIEVRVAAVLPAAYKELEYIQDVNKNGEFLNKQRYGVRPLAGEGINTITNSYTANQVFEVILTHDYVNQQDDSDQRAKMFLLLDEVDTILKDVIKSKVGLNSIVLKIDDFTIVETEFIEEESLVVQRLQLTVQYRQAV